MSLSRKNLRTVQEVDGYTYEQNVDIPLRSTEKGGVIRANVYRPNKQGRFPVLVTYGPCMCSTSKLSAFHQLILAH